MTAGTSTRVLRVVRMYPLALLVPRENRWYSTCTTELRGTDTSDAVNSVLNKKLQNIKRVVTR